MIVISDSVVVQNPAIDARNPRIGYKNLVTPSNVFADQEDLEHRALNVANPATYLYWSGVNTAAQTIGIHLQTARTVNYVGLARHNFGSTGAQYIVEQSVNGADWYPITDARIPVDDSPLIHEFEDTFASWFRLSITPDAGIPEIAVMYFGEIMRVERRLFVGHTPIPFGRLTTVSNGKSEEGQYLGRVLRRTMFETSIQFQNLTSSWVRNEFLPFLDAVPVTPFFWAWRPLTFSNETAYVWTKDDPKVVNQRPNGMMQISLEVQGIR